MKPSLKEIRVGLKVCTDTYNYFRKHGRVCRRQHSWNCLRVARNKRNEEAEARILAIIQREKDRAYRRKLNYGMKKTGEEVPELSWKQWVMVQ